MKRVLIALALAISGTAATLIDKDTYLNEIAPVQLKKIAEYRARKGSGLTPAQAATLDQAEIVIRNYVTDDIAALENQCNGAFGKDKCFKILVSGSVSLAGTNKALDWIYCTCSTASDWCFGGHCHPGAQGCQIQSGTCAVR